MDNRNRRSTLCFSVSLILFLTVYMGAPHASAGSLDHPTADSNVQDSLPSEIQIFYKKHGRGAALTAGATMMYNLTSRVKNGPLLFDSKRRGSTLSFRLETKILNGEGLQRVLAILRNGDSVAVTVPPQFAHGLAGDDAQGVPVNASISYEIEVVDVLHSDLSEVLLNAIESGGVKAGETVLSDLERVGFKDTFASKESLDWLGGVYGYRYSNFPVAEEVLKWNVRLYAQSAQAEFSLARLYFAYGHRVEASSHTSKALVLDPKFEPALKLYERLSSSDAVPTIADQVQTLLRLAPAYSGPTAGRKPINLQYLAEMSSKYFEGVHEEDEEELAKIVASFRKVVAVYNSDLSNRAIASLKKRQSLEGQMQASLQAEITRQNESVGRGIESQLTTPIALEFIGLGGEKVDLTDMRGKVVVLFFGATWSAYSQKTLEILQRVYEKRHQDGLEVIGVYMDSQIDSNSSGASVTGSPDPATQVAAYVKAHKVRWPVYHDGFGELGPLGQKFKVDTLPKVFILDQRGMFIEMIDTEPERIESSVSTLLDPERGSQKSALSRVQ